MLAEAVQMLLGALEGLLPPELLAPLRAWAGLIGLAAIAGAGVSALVAAWLVWRRVRRTAGFLGRSSVLVRSAAGRRALRLSGEIRRGCKRLRRVIGQTLADRGERRSLESLLERFVREDLETALERMHTWVAIGGAIRVRELERAVEDATSRWSGMADGPPRRALEQSLARMKQQLALARRTADDRERLLSGLEEAAAAIRTLEAELVALGEARSQALPGFREHLGELSEDLRRQRDVHLEFPARPG